MLTPYVPGGAVAGLSHRPFDGYEGSESPSHGQAERRDGQDASQQRRDYRRTFFTANPDATGEVVVHHAVEQQTRQRYPGAGVTMGEMHSLENLRGIPKGEVNNRVHLSAIRKKWNKFYRENPNPTKAELLAFATLVDDEYGHQFNPPIRPEVPEQESP